MKESEKAKKEAKIHVFSPDPSKKPREDPKRRKERGDGIETLLLSCF
jgi:hypothetical protein